ncbi:MAG: hypothetical protein GX131_11770 [candidate division WS1 bacterium]|jgi:hypothetical protein|nr:hypothetical protein [candidate division WS1 bacterium]
MRYTIVIVAALLTAAATTAFCDSYEIKVYPCARATDGVVIDGDLRDAAWQRAPVVNEFTFHNKPEAVDVQTHFGVLYTDSDLILGIRFDEPNMDKLTPVSQPRDSMGVFQGEAVEIFVDPGHDQQRYHQIAVNSAASIYDSLRTDPSWSGDVRAATKLMDDHWTMEVAIPWADLGVKPEPGSIVGLNVCRDRHLGANKTWSNWSQTAANFHDPERFGHVVLSPSAAMIGELADDFRLGARQGPIIVYGPDGFVQGAYRSIAAGSFAAAEERLAELERIAAGETNAAARDELLGRIADYRTELAGFRQTASGAAAPRETWHGLNHRVAQIQEELGTVIWEARLTALLSGV